MSGLVHAGQSVVRGVAGAFGLRRPDAPSPTTVPAAPADLANNTPSQQMAVQAQEAQQAVKGAGVAESMNEAGMGRRKAASKDLLGG